MKSTSTTNITIESGTFQEPRMNTAAVMSAKMPERRTKEFQLSKLAACDRETNIEQADGRCPHLLKLLLSGEVEDEADYEGDAHDEEEDGTDDVDHQVQSEVAHFGDIEQMLFVRLSLATF